MNRSWNFAMSYVSDKKVILASLIFFFVISLSRNSISVENNKNGNDDVKEQIEKLLKDDAAGDIKTTEFLATTEAISPDNARKAEESKKPSISVAGIDDEGKRTDAVLKSANVSSSSDSNKSETEEKSKKKNNDDDNSNNEEVPKKNASETVEEAFLPAEVSTTFKFYVNDIRQGEIKINVTQISFQGAAEQEHTSSLAIFFVLFVLVRFFHIMLNNWYFSFIFYFSFRFSAYFSYILSFKINVIIFPNHSQLYFSEPSLEL